MKRLLVLLFLFTVLLSVNAQVDTGSIASITGEGNLKAVITLSPYTSAVGFDNRYQGIKGTPRLIDSLVNSLVLITGQEKYYRMQIDVDVVKNAIVFRTEPGEELMEILSDKISEIIVNSDTKPQVYRTTNGLKFEKELRENKFYTILKDGPRQFIKIPDKKFVEADYQRAYSQDRRYDEFKDDDKYYILSNDSIYHRVQLNRKSLEKLFPESRQIINENFNEKRSANPEADIVLLLEKM